MTDLQKSRFIERFSRDYDLPAAAVCAGIGRGQAYALLREGGARAELERQILRRVRGEVLHHIRAEYEELAFGGESRGAEKLRALEQLRLLASAEGGDGAAPGITIRVEYV